MTEETTRRRSTGRTPALAPSDIESMLSRYFDEDKPSLATLAEEFPRTDKAGKQHSLSLATVRKYLKAAGIQLPRGRANDLPREPQKVRTLMNRIPTEVLIGPGRAKLLARKIASGVGSLTSLAKEFGVSKDRVRRVRDLHAPVEPVVEPAEVVMTEEDAEDLAVEERIVEADRKEVANEEGELADLTSVMVPQEATDGD